MSGALRAYRAAGTQDKVFDFYKLLAIAKRQAWVLIVASILGVCGGVAYMMNAIPLYSASTRVLIDDRAVRKVQDLVSPATDVGLADAAVDSQVEVIRSDAVGMAVVRKLKLAEDASFLSTNETAFSRTVAAVRAAVDIRNLVKTPQQAATSPVAETMAFQKLQDGLTVRRVGRTYVLLIEYTSSDREEAARISNEFANAYLLDQLESKYNSTRRASGWLDERVKELQQQTRESDLAIQRFRAKNNLLAAGGRLISDQQSAELNSQVILARADTARARARFERIQAIRDSQDPTALVAEALQQSTFNELRSAYLLRAKRAADVADRLGPDHVQVASLRREMEDYAKLMFEELGRVAESYRSDFEIAKAREQSLEDSMSKALGVTAEANETQVTLHELERQADAYRALHQTFLSRFEETVQQQSFPVTDARIIKVASIPDIPSYPNGSRVIAISLMLGVTAGAGVGFLREKGDRVYRTGNQVRTDLNVDFLGMLPKIKIDGRAPPVILPVLQPGEFSSPPIMRYALDQPLSEYAETLRAVKIAADITLQSAACRIVGVVSMLPGEGKSTTAKNFATMLAKQGASTLLIDADLRNPALTRTLAPQSKTGLVEVLLEGAPMQTAILNEPESGLAFLPTPVATRMSHTGDLLSSAAMRELLVQAGASYKYMIVDLPPTGPVVEVRAVAHLFSGFVFVVEWGKTPRGDIAGTFEAERQLRERCLGVVLNKANMRKARTYEDYGGRGYMPRR